MSPREPLIDRTPFLEQLVSFYMFKAAVAKQGQKGENSKMWLSEVQETKQQLKVEHKRVSGLAFRHAPRLSCK